MTARFAALGRAGQIRHPHIRGALPRDRSIMGKVVEAGGLASTPDETFFVPSFSIRRHLDRSEEQVWHARRSELRRRLGRGYVVNSPEDITIKAIDQHRFIKRMQQAGIRPDSQEIRDIAYGIRDQLTDLLANARSPLLIPLGSLGRYGYRNNALAHTIEGWRGDRAHYGEQDTDGYVGVLAALQAERRIAVGAIALAYGEDGLDVDGIAPSPHATIARSREPIEDFELRGLRGRLADAVADAALFGDPVIDMKLYPGEPAERIYVKHAWTSLAIPA